MRVSGVLDQRSGSFEEAVEKSNRVSEKAFKGRAISHGTEYASTSLICWFQKRPTDSIGRFGPRRLVATTGYLDVTYIDPYHLPAVEFTFKYRSKCRSNCPLHALNAAQSYASLAALQALIIVPQSPTPVPLEERPIDSLNVQELRELARRNQVRHENRAVLHGSSISR